MVIFFATFISDIQTLLCLIGYLIAVSESLAVPRYGYVIFLALK